MIPQGRGTDRSSCEPACIQLVDILRVAIAGGRYQAGDPPPTESELSAAHDASPITERRGIGMPVDKSAGDDETPLSWGRFISSGGIVDEQTCGWIGADLRADDASRGVQLIRETIAAARR